MMASPMRTDGGLQETTWQQKIYLATLDMVESSNHEDEHEPAAVSLFSSAAAPDWLFDNTSNRCVRWMEGLDASCSDPSVLRIALQYAKTLFYKVVRSYGAAPVFLMLAPLLVGLLVGLWFGRKWEQQDTCEWVRGTEDMTEKEDRARSELRSDANMQRESGVDLSTVPRHVAVIMDGNRRYGKARYGDSTKGHWDGSRMLLDFAKWCIAEGVQVLTVYAFSTENWNRDPAEVASLMAIFCKYCDELRVEALARNIRVRVLSSDKDRIPFHVQRAMTRLVDETQDCHGGLCLNVCLSYGSRGEIVNACRSLAKDAAEGTILPDSIQEQDLTARLLTSHCPDPDIVIRTSGEYRLSNFLLWQLSYSEIFVLQKQWPELQKEDLVQVIRTYAKKRCRRFGK